MTASHCEDAAIGSAEDMIVGRAIHTAIGHVRRRRGRLFDNAAQIVLNLFECLAKLVERLQRLRDIRQQSQAIEYLLHPLLNAPRPIDFVGH
jgi:hypothetical protein